MLGTRTDIENVNVVEHPLAVVAVERRDDRHKSARRSDTRATRRPTTARDGTDPPHTTSSESPSSAVAWPLRRVGDAPDDDSDGDVAIMLVL